LAWEIPARLRLSPALKYPECTTGLVTQNGDAYFEGLSDGWAPIRTYWENPQAAESRRAPVLCTEEITRWQYYTGRQLLRSRNEC
jgi:hypothetical protein